MFWSAWTSGKARWLAAQEAKLRERYATQLKAMEESLEQQVAVLNQRKDELVRAKETLDRQQSELDNLVQRNLDRKEELAQANQELRTQIRLIEAKARPDEVWTSAFAKGYEKAWDTMLPVMLDGVQKVRETIRDGAINSIMANIDAIAKQRIEQIGGKRLRQNMELAEKRKDLERKREAAKTDPERLKYEHYLEALGWALDGRAVP